MKGEIYFKETNVRCPQQKFCDVVKNSTFNRKLIFLRIKGQNCIIQKDEYSDCDKIFLKRFDLKQKHQDEKHKNYKNHLSF